MDSRVDASVEIFPRSLTRLYVPNIDHMYFKKWVRFLLSYMAGGGIYALKCNGEYAGYCMISNGKSGRYEYAEKTDITVGPIYIKQDYRGRGLSKVLLREVLKHYENGTTRCAFAYIHRINKQSNALFAGAGFEIVSNLEVTRFTRHVRVTQEENTDYRLYRRELSAN